MKLTKLIAAMALTGLVSTSANAGFLEGLSTVLDGVGQVAESVIELPGKAIDSVGAEMNKNNPDTANTVEQSAEIDKLLVYYKNKAPSSKFGVARTGNNVKLQASGCSTASFDAMTEDFNVAGAGNDGDLMKYNAERLVSSFADCALIKKEGKHEIPNGSDMQTYVFKAGESLAVLARLNYSHKEREDAIKFLRWSGKDANGSVEERLNKAFGKGEISKDMPMFKGTAKALVDARNANTRAFDKKYNKQIVQISGKISSIGGDENSVYFLFRGNNVDNANDQLYCNITNENEILKSERFRKGQNVVVKGVYKPGFVDSSIENCGIM